MNAKIFEDAFAFFPYGVQYHRAPTPLPDEWEGDLRAIAAAGYTHVQYRPQWRWHERERGTRIWSDLDRLFDLAAANGLRVVLKPMLETAPDWVFSDLGGTRIGFHGIPIKPIAHGAYYVGGWWPCFDNPEVAAAAEAFVAELITRYVKHPALWFYDAWNEPVSRPIGQCQCAHSVASYRQWLTRRFGSVQHLNDFLGKAWTSLETVEPPSAAADYAEMFLWRQWAADAVAEHVAQVARTIRRSDAGAFILVHAGSPTITQDPVCATSDDVANSRETDRFGSSFGIPLHPQTPLEHAAPDFQSDWLRRVDPHYWVHEFYPNKGGWCIPPHPATLRRLVWMAIAGGLRGLTYWQYRSERVGCETNGFGIREIDGTQTARGEVVEAIGQKLATLGPALAQSQRGKARVALLHSRESDIIARLQHLTPWPADVAQEGASDGHFYKQAIKAAHALYLMEGYEVDWVLPGDDLSLYPLIHLTACEMISAPLARDLEAYVEKGGRLIVEFPFACRDANTWVSLRRPGLGLEALLGVFEARREKVSQPQPVTFSSGCEVQATGWRIDLIPREGAEPMAWWQDGAVAGVSHPKGEGRVVALGANLSLAFADHWEDPVRPRFREVLHLIGAPIPESNTEGVWVRRRQSRTGDFLFIFNVSNETKAIPLPEPTATVIEAEGARQEGMSLVLSPGGCWVAQMAPTGRNPDTL